jgi:RNA polymerase sigma-70 factor (ECF subfamily)
MLEGDEEAFRVFFNTYYPRLAAFVTRRFSLDAASVDDIVQAALIKAMRRLYTYRGDASLFTWLCTICWREFLTIRRKEQKHLGCESLESLPESNLIELRAPEHCEPDCVSDAESVRSAITKTLGELPDHYARALELKYVEGRAVDELAATMGITVIGAQSLLGRARAAFRLACPESGLEALGS